MKIHILTLFFTLFFNPISCQFGEIASVVSGLLGSGGGAGLAGLAGPLGSSGGLASLGSLGSGAASGASGALGNLGGIYQLAQAALQLTGTGVNIANTASESAWFPVVVENAAKMNRDFQERLLHGGSLSGSAGRSTAIDRTGNLGKEYGKKFDSSEDGDSISSHRPILPSVTLAPLPVQPNARELPNIIGLLPGEFPSEMNGNTDGASFTTTEYVETTSSVPVIEPALPISKPVSIDGNGPEITFKLPEPNPNSAIAERSKIPPRHEGGLEPFDKKMSIIEQVEFSSDGENETSILGTDEDKELAPLLPPRANPIPDEITMSKIETMETLDGMNVTSEMVPQLKKLLANLKSGNLTDGEIMEITSQLANNGNVQEPRENTEAPSDSEATNPSPKYNDKDDGKVINDDKERAVHRNLAALRRVFNNDESFVTPRVLVLERPKISRGSINIPPSIQLVKKVVHDPTPQLQELLSSLNPPTISTQNGQNKNTNLEPGSKSNKEFSNSTSLSNNVQNQRIRTDAYEKRPVESNKTKDLSLPVIDFDSDSTVQETTDNGATIKNSIQRNKPFRARARARAQTIANIPPMRELVATNLHKLEPISKREPSRDYHWHRDHQWQGGQQDLKQQNRQQNIHSSYQETPYQAQQKEWNYHNYPVHNPNYQMQQMHNFYAPPYQQPYISYNRGDENRFPSNMQIPVNNNYQQPVNTQGFNNNLQYGRVINQHQYQSPVNFKSTSQLQNYPIREVNEVISTTPPYVVHHPLSNGALLTLMQPRP